MPKRKSNKMANPRYNHSISINALVRLIVCTRINNKINHESFDYHQTGLTLINAAANLDLHQIKKPSSGGITKVSTWLDIKEEKSWPVALDIQEDIKTAIREKKLPLDNAHTAQLCEIRIKHNVATEWCKDYHHTSSLFDTNLIKLTSMYSTLAALLTLYKASKSSIHPPSQDDIAAEVAAKLKEFGKNLAEDTIKRIFTESNNSLK